MEKVILHSKSNASIKRDQCVYELVFKLGEDISRQIRLEQEAFYSNFLAQQKKLPMTDILACRLVASELMEETLIRWMQRIISAQSAFTVTLNNYSGFPPGTVYLRVQDHKPFKQMSASLQVVDQYIRSNDCPPADLTIRPQVIIADHISPAIYDKAIMDYAQRSFYASLELTQLTLLKKKVPSDSFKQVCIFQLRPAGTLAY